MTDTRVSENSPTQVQIGATTYTGVVLTAMKIQAVGGGDIVKSRTTANNTEPVGDTAYPVEAIVVVTLDADVIPALLTAGYVSMTAAPAALSAFIITELDAPKTKTRTITYTASKSKIQGVSAKHATLGDQIHEITILTRGTITYSAWA
jgi:hypothetical protein